MVSAPPHDIFLAMILHRCIFMQKFLAFAWIEAIKWFSRPQTGRLRQLTGEGDHWHFSPKSPFAIVRVLQVAHQTIDVFHSLSYAANAQYASIFCQDQPDSDWSLQSSSRDSFPKIVNERNDRSDRCFVTHGKL